MKRDASGSSLAAMLRVFAVTVLVSSCQCGLQPHDPLRFCETAEPLAGCEEQKASGVWPAEVVCSPWRGAGVVRLELCPMDVSRALDAGTSRYDALAAEACLSSLEAGGGGVPEACRRVFTGTAPDGAACDSASECASGWCSQGCPRRCGPCLGAGCRRGPGEAGAACGEGCRPGLRCEAGLCRVELRRAGERCGPEAQCQALLRCVDGTCVAGASPGAACSGSEPCRVDAVCGSEGRCLLRPTAGEACTGSTCAAGGRCLEGTCVVPGQFGEPCGLQGCRTGLDCRGGRCAVPACE